LVYSRPATPFVADFVGLTNRMQGTVRGGSVEVRGTSIPLVQPDVSDGPAIALIRPEAVSIDGNGGTDEGPLVGTVIAVAFLGAGPVLRTGSRAAYRAVEELEGEPHVVRTELVDSPGGDLETEGPTIACIAHITDLHVTDAQSPARFEWVNRYSQDPRFRELITMQRPQETLNAHAIAATVRTVNRVEAAPVTGAAVALAVMTGDAIDNTQRNELTNF